MLIIIDNSVYLPKSNSNLYKFLKSNRLPFVKVKNFDELNVCLDKNIPTKFVLTGSPLMFHKKHFETYKSVFDLNVYILEKFGNRIPIYGICFGAQLITLFYGGVLEKLEKEFSKTIPGRGDRKYFFCLNYRIRRLPKRFKTEFKIRELGTVSFSTGNKMIRGFLFHPETYRETWEDLRFI